MDAQTLGDIYRMLGQRPYVCVLSQNRRLARVLGFGPNGKLIAWYEGDETVYEWDRDTKAEFRASF